MYAYACKKNSAPYKYTCVRVNRMIYENTNLHVCTMHCPLVNCKVLDDFLSTDGSIRYIALGAVYHCIAHIINICMHMYVCTNYRLQKKAK